jgi:hypothetical protein
MSYPSINRHLDARRISLETASDAELTKYSRDKSQAQRDVDAFARGRQL